MYALSFPDNQDSYTKGLNGQVLIQMDMLVKGMIQVRGGMDQDSTRDFFMPLRRVCHLTYELFISGIFHLIVFDSSWPQVTETTDKWETNRT